MKSGIFEKLMDNFFRVFFGGQAMVPMLGIFMERLLIFVEQ